MSYNNFMEIPYYILGLIYLVIIGFYLVLVFFNLYHLVRFGFFDFTGKLNLFLFCCAWGIILVFTWFFLRNIDWLSTFDPINEIYAAY